MATVRYFNIKWELDADYKESGYPDELTIATDPSVLDDENAEAIIADMLSESTGWYHNGFEYEIIG